jgi:hypothetical protein
MKNPLLLFLLSVVSINLGFCQAQNLTSRSYSSSILCKSKWVIIKTYDRNNPDSVCYHRNKDSIFYRITKSYSSITFLKNGRCIIIDSGRIIPKKGINVHDRIANLPLNKAQQDSANAANEMEISMEKYWKEQNHDTSTAHYLKTREYHDPIKLKVWHTIDTVYWSFDTIDDSHSVRIIMFGKKNHNQKIEYGYPSFMLYDVNKYYLANKTGNSDIGDATKEQIKSAYVLRSTGKNGYFHQDKVFTQR